MPIPGSLSNTQTSAAKDATEEDSACPGPHLPRPPSHLNSVITEAVSMPMAGPLPWNPTPLPSPGALCSLPSSSPARKQWAPSLSTGVAGREGVLISLWLSWDSSWGVFGANEYESYRLEPGPRGPAWGM